MRYAIEVTLTVLASVAVVAAAFAFEIVLPIVMLLHLIEVLS